MTKGSSSKKKPKPPVDIPGVKKEPSFKKPGKVPTEIDEIFAGIKKKRIETDMVYRKGKTGKELSADKKESRDMKAAKKTKNIEEHNPFAVSSSRKRKKTADGLTIYTEEELGVGRSDAGQTPLCPFDCDCCF